MNLLVQLSHSIFTAAWSAVPTIRALAAYTLLVRILYVLVVKLRHSSSFVVLGVILRLPIAAFVMFLWAIFLSPFIIYFTFVVLMGQVVFYPVIRTGIYLLAAFAGEEKEPRLDEYWKDFPLKYWKWLRFGTLSVEEWMLGPASRKN